MCVTSIQLPFKSFTSFLEDFIMKINISQAKIVHTMVINSSVTLGAQIMKARGRLEERSWTGDRYQCYHGCING